MLRRTSIRRTASIAVLALASFATPAHTDLKPCAPVTFEGLAFTVCRADPASMDVRLFLNRPNGEKYGRLDALPSDDLLFATNAGMYTPEHEPAGLYVENAIQRKSLNTRTSGYGNFHLQPNGVFWILDGKAAVSTTADYARLKLAPELATQSGPMLVIDDKINAKFDDDGPSRYVRNGVGVTASGDVVIAISEVPVSFGAFARLFRESLKAPNALYFDGSVSRLLIPGEARNLNGASFGPMLGVYARGK